MATLTERVHAALAVVRDPELDEAITALGFVSAVTVDGTAVTVRLRLPTYFCAPNFAWLMVADAKHAVAAVDGVTAVDVSLDDHATSAQINTGVARGADFADAFPGQADGSGLTELRMRFRRKAFQARQYRLLAALRRRGAGDAELCALRVGDLGPGPETAVYLARRAELGLPVDAAAPVVLTVDGQAVAAKDLDAHLVRLRTVSVSIEGNAGFCRGLLATRYGGRPAARPREERSETTKEPL